jgi:hypothetical protein
MTESTADGTAVEKAYRDIDEYVSRTSQLSPNDVQSAPNDAQLLSPSQRLRVLGRQQQGSSTIQPAAQEIATQLSANEF